MDELELLVDAEFGVLLRLACRARGELVEVHELDEVTFDADAEPPAEPAADPDPDPEVRAEVSPGAPAPEVVPEVAPTGGTRVGTGAEAGTDEAPVDAAAADPVTAPAPAVPEPAGTPRGRPVADSGPPAFEPGAAGSPVVAVEPGGAPVVGRVAPAVVEPVGAAPAEVTSGGAAPGTGSPRAVSLDEAVRGAGFPILLPRKLPGAPKLLVLLDEGGGEAGSVVLLRYQFEAPTHYLHLEERRADGAGGAPAEVPFERREHQGHAVEVWESQGRDRAVRVEREGIAVRLDSDLDLQTLLRIAVTLAPIRMTRFPRGGRPPALRGNGGNGGASR